MSVTVEYVQATRDTLCRVLGPSFAVDDAILIRPPFRFFYDVAGAAAMKFGFGIGLFAGPELDVAAIRTRHGRDAKLLYLRKIAALASMTTGVVVTCKPSKIVAGSDSEGANNLLRAIADAAEARHVEHDVYVGRIRAATEKEWHRVYGAEPSPVLTDPAPLAQQQQQQQQLSARSTGSAVSDVGMGTAIGGRPPTAPKRRPQGLPPASAREDHVEVMNPQRASLLLGLGGATAEGLSASGPASGSPRGSLPPVMIPVGRPSTAPGKRVSPTAEASRGSAVPGSRPPTPGGRTPRPSTAAVTPAALEALQQLAACGGGSARALASGRPTSAAAPAASAHDARAHAATRSAEEAMLAILIGSEDEPWDDGDEEDSSSAVDAAGGPRGGTMRLASLDASPDTVAAAFAMAMRATDGAASHGPLLAALAPLLRPVRSPSVLAARYRASGAGRQAWPLLHQAVGGGRPELAALLLGCGADAGATDSEGQTPLHLAAAAIATPEAHGPRAGPATSGLLRLLLLLARQGGEPGSSGGAGGGLLCAPDAYALTPLHVLAQRSSSSPAPRDGARVLRALHLFLGAGADASLKDRFGDTPSDAAASEAVAQTLRSWAPRSAKPSPDLSRLSPLSLRSLPTIACHVAAFIGSPESLRAARAACWAAWDLAALCGLGWPRGAAGTELLSECAARRWPVRGEGSSSDMRAEPEAPAADFLGASEQALREALGLPEAAVARTLSAAPSDLSWGGGRRASPGLPRSAGSTRSAGTAGTRG